MSAKFRFHQRLHNPQDFSNVFQVRKVLRGVFFDLNYCVTSQKTQASRLGLITPKRFAKSASVRNALKRLSREIFRQSILFVPTFDVVVRLKKSVSGVSASSRDDRLSWRSDIESLFSRLPRS